MLNSLYKALQIRDDKYLINYFEKRYKTKYEGKDDLFLVHKEVEQTRIRYNLINEQPAESDIKKGFESFIINIELILDMKIDRNLKLYQLKDYNDLAVEKLTELKKNKNNGES